MKIWFLILIFVCSFGCNKKKESSANVFDTILDQTTSPPKSISYTSSSLVLTKGSAMVSLTPTYVSTAQYIAFRVSPSLPLGLSLNPSTGLISGIPTIVQDQKTYTLSVVNENGAATFDIDIKVNDIAPTSITYSQLTFTFNRAEIFSIAAPTTTGGTPLSYSISPTLPIGVTFDTSTGEISGRSYVSSSLQSYVVKGINSGGEYSRVISFEFKGVAPSSLEYVISASYFAGLDELNILPMYSGDIATTFSITPTAQVPAGIVLDASTGVLSGVAGSSTNQSYLITAKNSWGQSSYSFNLKIEDYITSMSTGNSHSCVIRNKSVYCFGKNDLKQVGTNASEICVDAVLAPSDCVKTPKLVVDSNGIAIQAKKIVSSMNANCALTFDGKIYCWGSNHYGQLGVGSSELSIVAPTFVKYNGLSLSGIKNISAGENNFCASDSNDFIYCWGDNQFGQLGNLVLLSSSQAVNVVNENQSFFKGKNLVSGSNHSCVSDNNKIYCWGSNLYNQLGTLIVQNYQSPVESQKEDLSSIFTNVSQIYAGKSFSIVKTENLIYGVGSNSYGELKTGDSVSRQLFSLTGYSNYEKYFTAEESICGLLNSKIDCFGKNNYNFSNSESINSSTYLPLPVKESNGDVVSGITNMSVGFGSHRCFSRKAELYCLGNNEFGQVGNNTQDLIIFGQRIIF